MNRSTVDEPYHPTNSTMDSSSGAAASGNQGKCPVDHTKMAAAKSAPPSACPMHEKPAGHPAGGDISACPMHSDNQGSKKGKVYNVYMQEINPTNNMPANPNQVRGSSISALLRITMQA